MTLRFSSQQLIIDVFVVGAFHSLTPKKEHASKRFECSTHSLFITRINSLELSVLHHVANHLTNVIASKP